MRGKEKLFPGSEIAAFAHRCAEDFRSCEDPVRALELLAERAGKELGEYLSTSMIADPDEISMAFVELLDQIIFQAGERRVHGSEPGEEYVLQDLYSRAEIFLDAYEGAEVYKKNLAGRILLHDDTLVIQSLRLGELVPFLISEFFEQPHLRIAIMRALVYFRNEELLNFFYEVSRNEYDPELKIMALIGLKRNETVFYGWKRLAESNGEWYRGLVSHASSCEGNCAHPDDEGDDPHLLLYQTLCLELALAGEADAMKFRRFYGVLNGIARQNFETYPYRSTILDSLSRTLNRMGGEALVEFLSAGGEMKSFIHLLDCVPVEVFDRVLPVIESMEDRFALILGRMAGRGELRMDFAASRLTAHLLPAGLTGRLV
jgi:hypothetical protein